MQQFISERVKINVLNRIQSNGFPSIQNNIASYVPMDIFPVQGTWKADPKGKQKHNGKSGTWVGQTKIPKGYRGFIIFLDEFNSASLAVQAASYKLILDKHVGQHALHKDAAIICAGNLQTDGAITNRMGTAMQSRLIHLELIPDIEDWLEWGATNNIDHRILSYVHFRPENLFKFNPNHDDKTFACPRTWEFCSRLLEQIKKPLREYVPLISGTIGNGVAREFISHTEIFTNLPSIDAIINNPTGAIVNEDPAMLYAVSHMIAAYATKPNMDRLMQYVERLPLEFETITLQHIIRKNPTMIDEQSVKDWITIKGEELF